MKLSFQGASGRIQFNEQQEKPSFVNIFQVLNGMPELIGIYDPFAQNVTFTDHMPRYIPGDTFETRYELLPFWLGGWTLTAQSILFCIITINMVLYFFGGERIEKSKQAAQF